MQETHFWAISPHNYHIITNYSLLPLLWSLGVHHKTMLKYNKINKLRESGDKLISQRTGKLGNRWTMFQTATRGWAGHRICLFDRRLKTEGDGSDSLEKVEVRYHSGQEIDVVHIVEEETTTYDLGWMRWLNIRKAVIICRSWIRCFMTYCF